MGQCELEWGRTVFEQNPSALMDKLQMEKLERKKLQELLMELPVGVAILKGGDTLYFEEANPAFLQVEGYTQSELLEDKRSFNDYIYKEDINRFEDMVENCREQKTTEQMDIRFLGKDGKLHWSMVQCRLYVYRSVTPYYLVTSFNIDERKAQEDTLKSADKKLQRQLTEEVRLDPLTRLLNKVAVGEAAMQVIEEEPDATHVLFLIDIDNFKKVNDTFGHTVGDTVILDVAQVLAKQFEDDCLVGRVGGDEFLVFMRDTTIEQARMNAVRLCGEATKQLIGDDAVVNVTLSVGIAVYGVDGWDYETLFDMADRAMYHIKRNGKNNFHFMEKGEEKADLSGRHRVGGADDGYVRGKDADKEFLHFAFSLLSHARDINGSLNVLVEQIGKKYRVDFAVVFEETEAGDEVVLTNGWSKYGQIPVHRAFPLKTPEFETARVGEVVMVEEPKGAAWTVCNGSDKSRVHIQHIAMVKFEFSGNRDGRLCIGWHHKDDGLSSSEESTFGELGRVVGVFVTLRRKLSEDQKEIQNLQERDMLTGLYNLETFRMKTKERLAERDEENKVYALVHMDVNNFSYVNENFGLQVGDHILQELAEQIREAEYVVEACHLYSDYFVELICGNSQEELYQKVLEENQKFQKRQKEKYPASTMSLSAGICLVSCRKESFEKLLEGANLARKQAKADKNISAVVYRDDMREKRDAAIQITGRFYAAMQRGEIEVFLQPKFLLDEQRIYGAEALARWKNAAGEIIPPAEFIPSLENMGYIVDLDFFILEQLLRAMKRWKNAGKELFTVSTNFSRRHFENGVEHFIKRLQELMNRYEIAPEYIEIEVTESVIVDNLDNLKICLTELVKAGFRIAIDDFGTGYSSLSVLMEVPANVIKIDKQFTERISVAEQREFVTQMGQFIRAAKSEIVFEGIEKEAQRQFLLDCGFTCGQGYLFDKPLPLEEFERKYI